MMPATDHILQSCPVLPTTVLDSSDSLTLSFQSWEDPGFLGHPGTLPSCPSQQAAHAVRRIPWDPPLVSLHRHRAPCCPEDPLDISGSSLQVPLTQLSGGSFGHPGILPSGPSHTAVWRILWTLPSCPAHTTAPCCLVASFSGVVC